MDVRRWIEKQIAAQEGAEDKFAATSDSVTFEFGFMSILSRINDLEKDLSKARKSDASNQQALDIILAEIVKDLGPGSPHSEALAAAARLDAARKEIKANWRFF